MLAVIAMRESDVVTVFDLRSGVLQSTIDAGMKVYGLGLIKNTAFVIGCWKVGAWDLPVGDGAQVPRRVLKIALGR